MVRIRATHLTQPLVCAALLALGQRLLGTPRPWMESPGPAAVFGTTILFGAWLWALWGWGTRFERFLLKGRPRWPSALAWGSALLAAAGALLYATDLFSPQARLGLAQAILAVGAALAPRPRPRFRDLFPNSPSEFLLSTLLVATGATLLLPNSFWDPLWYNLQAPRQWALSGRIHFEPSQILSARASTWEYLYLWPNLLLGGKGNERLIEIQLFAQWTHFAVGVLGSVAILRRLLGRIFPAPGARAWIPVAALAALTEYTLHYSSLSAKNDWGVLLWFLAGLSLLIDSRKRSALLIPAGGLLGVAAGAKLSALPLALIALGWLAPRHPRSLLKAGATFAIGVLPQAIRNLLWTSNPFFPSMSSWFPSRWLGPTWIAGARRIEETPQGEFWSALRLEGKLPLLVSSWRPWVGAALCVILWRGLSRQSWPTRLKARLLGFAATGVLLALLTSGPMAELRAAAPALALLWATSLLICFAPAPAKMAPWIALSLLAHPKLFRIPAIKPADLAQVLTGSRSLSESLQGHRGIQAAAWLQTNASPGDRIFLLADTRLYYYSGLRASRLWDEAELDRELQRCKTAQELAQVLKSRGGTYLADSLDEIDSFQDAPRVLALAAYLRTQQQAIVFVSPLGDWVVDLRKLD